METQVRTPQMVFMQPQRLIVPLFQRPYVWNQDNQWEPLWSDVVRVAQRLLASPSGQHHPHFLGAVVVQQVQNPVGTMQERTIIDGQQRLTTLQLLLDALRIEFDAVGAVQPAMRIHALVANAEAFWERDDDQFKVWPTNRDRPAFHAVMSGGGAIAVGLPEHRTSRLVQAHQYFSAQARAWLSIEGEGSLDTRAAALERTVREQLQMVVIDLTADENAQEIFETLNARGAQLTPADLIKNFVFQRLMEAGENVEAAYEQYWRDFETGFWEAEVSAGRVRHPRSSMFLNQWLIARTGEEILAREVFQRFKRFADFDAGISMVELLAQIHRAAMIYRKFVTSATQFTGPIDRLGLFAYRAGVLESEVTKPLVLFLLDAEEPPIPEQQLSKAIEVVESWLVRRTLVRVTSKSYTQVMAELISEVRKGERASAGDLLEEYLQSQTGANRYWPDDDEVKRELHTLPIYRRLSRARLRMVLEAIEDHRRGWRGSATGLGGERVARGKYAIEHVMPRKWQAHWPLEGGTAADRDALIHTLGNLTLLTSRLNSKVSNGPWSTVKRSALEAHDVLMLNRELMADAGLEWTDEGIQARTRGLISSVLDVWAVPPGHRSPVIARGERPKRKVELADLLTAGLLEEGATLYARRQRVSDRTATVLPDGALDVDGTRHATPSGAAKAVSGTSENGWWFWLVNPRSKLSLASLWREYVDERAVDVEDSEVPDEEDD